MLSVLIDKCPSKAHELTLLTEDIHTFKKLVVEADNRAIKNNNEISAMDALSIKEKFNCIYRLLNALISDASDLPETIKHEIGSIAKQEFFPYMLLSNAGERFYSKPRGYAGDYYTIEMIYQNIPKGVGRLGCTLDQCFLNLSAAQAVRNRRGLLFEQIQKTLIETNASTVNIMSMACGPAREVIDAFEAIDDKKRIKATLLDFDSDALAFCKEKIDNAKLIDIHS